MKASVAQSGIIIAIASCAAFGQSNSSARPDGDLLFGMSTALSGPATQLGVNMKSGVDAAFSEANRAGGIQGQLLRLIALDDGYEPARTVPNMRALIDEHNVLAVVGNVGTPTAVVAIPIANQSATVLFGSYTGAGVLRKSPPDRYVINFRASYAEETAAMVNALINEVGIAPREVAFFTQRDAYGDAGYVGGLAALRNNGLASEAEVAHGRYERNTLAVENALADILMADPPVRAVIMVGAYAPCAAFIELARQYELDAIFLNVSFVGSAPLAKALGPLGEGVVITQVVPHIDSKVPIVKAYRAALQADNPEATPTFGSLEGYIVGRIMTRAMSSLDGPPTRESIVEALEALGEFDIGLGVPQRLGPKNHQACHRVWPTIIRAGHVVPLDWSELREAKTGGRP